MNYPKNDKDSAMLNLQKRRRYNRACGVNLRKEDFGISKKPFDGNRYQPPGHFLAVYSL